MIFRKCQTPTCSMLHVFPCQSTFSSISLSFWVNNHPIFYNAPLSKVLLSIISRDFCSIFNCYLVHSIIFKFKINGQLPPGLDFTIFFSNIQTFSLNVSDICHDRHVNDMQLISGQDCSAYVYCYIAMNYN